MSRIVLENVNVHYPVLQDHYKSIRRAFLRLVTGGRMYREDANTSVVHAVKDFSLTLGDGERLGIVGRNGAGKSTLLKTMARFILPDSGSMLIEGKVTSLFSINGGMDVERTGYDNAFLMGRLYGLSRKEMEKHLKDIEEFSELGKFLSMPVRSYSDGMKVRLGFAIVTCLHPEILILDEAVGAGDAHFIEKATHRAQNLYEKANILVLASHDQAILKRLCNKAIWLDQGQIVKAGGVDEVIQAYNEATI